MNGWEKKHQRRGQDNHRNNYDNTQNMPYLNGLTQLKPVLQQSIAGIGS